MQIKIPRFQDAHRGSNQPVSIEFPWNILGTINPPGNPAHASLAQWLELDRAAEVLTLVALAIGTGLVGIEFQQALDHLLVLSSLTRSWTARHGFEEMSRESKLMFWEAKEGENRRWPVWEAVSRAKQRV